MEEPDSKTLIALLKERDKEVKNLQKKVAKLEERYIMKHRENTDLVSDRDNLLSFVKLVLENQYNKTPGGVNFEELETSWLAREEDIKRVIRNLTQNSTEEIQKLKSELNRFKEQIRVKDMELKELKALEENYACIKSQADEMRNENDILEKEIETLRIDNARLKSNHDEISKNKTEVLIAAMEQKTKDAVEENKIHKMLVDYQARINALEAELQLTSELKLLNSNLEEALKEQISQRDSISFKLQGTEEMLSITRSEFSEHRKKAQKIVLEKDQQLEKLKLRLREFEKSNEENDVISLLKLRIIELEKAQSRENINMEYLKNIVMRFMEYMYAGNMKEANTLACVIYTVLEFSNEEIELIRKARQSRVFLKGVKGMFSSTSPGVGVSHNTLHTIEGRKRMNMSIEESKEYQST
ncbi:hypothetical protein SteCoe_35509 [Stentor coeruleus]|uniref:GRIP domain-containing protein n=1 Tax=Stentor coeruleus TaxID=5963 RepID=A0A1R2AS68_9CILI|nr:hypothetical protein SteCoe_35509 [Stentor coeruleus]